MEKNNNKKISKRLNEEITTMLILLFFILYSAYAGIGFAVVSERVYFSFLFTALISCISTVLGLCVHAALKIVQEDAGKRK